MSTTEYFMIGALVLAAPHIPPTGARWISFVFVLIGTVAAIMGAP